MHSDLKLESNLDFCCHKIAPDILINDDTDKKYNLKKYDDEF